MQRYFLLRAWSPGMVMENKEAALACLTRDAQLPVTRGYEASRFGLTLTKLRVLRGAPEMKVADLEKLTEGDVKALFEISAWLPLGCDRLPVGLDYFLLDSGVMHGNELAARWLHFALGVPPMWPIRPAVAKQAREGDVRELILNIELYRRRYCKNHPYWVDLQEHWTNRTTRARMRAIRMLEGKPVKV